MNIVQEFVKYELDFFFLLIFHDDFSQRSEIINNFDNEISIKLEYIRDTMAQKQYMRQ